eukprot:GEMP01018921.1.p1 GENE.GEMP01018921.1~~GEMP01018921.1.p1  ORF type:complete len:350 (+),score=64.77 GEMP01018921.1:118-1167(+)
MHRSIPIGNKLCAKRRVQRDQELHREKIRQMKPQTDTSEPEVCRLDHIRNNLKREQMLEERYSEIDRENRILLQKMADIMRQPNFSAQKESKGPMSLNKDYRRQELIRITHENQAILKRIQKAQPVYNHVEWERAHKQNSSYMKNACEYPVVLKKRDMRENRVKPLQSEDEQKLDQGIETERGLSPTEDLGSNSRYVLKEGKKIGGNYYLVEMTTDGRTLTISAYDGDSQKTLELLVNEKNHRRLYRECNRDYSQIAQRLTVEGDKLTLSGMTQSASAPGDKTWLVDDMVKESTINPRVPKSQSKILDSKHSRGVSGVKVELDVDSSANVAINVRGITPPTPSIQSGYN